MFAGFQVVGVAGWAGMISGPGWGRLTVMQATTAKLMLGKPVADRILEQCRQRVRGLVERSGVRPCLAVVLVGDDPLAARYLERKGQGCERLGMTSRLVRLPALISTAELLGALEELGNDRSVHALLLQYPLPAHLDASTAFGAIPAAKDVDGICRPRSGLTSCTAEAVRRLLAAYAVGVAGKTAVVAGRGATLGEPLAQMLVADHALVTVCDGPVPRMAGRIGTGDLVVTALGQARVVRGEWLKAGAVVVDTGLNAVEGRPVGDVDFESASARASWITPVPGGVGPMTMAVLLERTASAAARQVGD